MREALEEASEGLPEIAWRKMFGLDTVFARGQIFALATRDGRIGVRLPDPAAFAEARNLPGSDRFDPGADGKPMAHWVLLPELLLDEPRAVREWVQRAHALAMTHPSRTKR